MHSHAPPLTHTLDYGATIDEFGDLLQDENQIVCDSCPMQPGGLVNQFGCDAYTKQCTCNRWDPIHMHGGTHSTIHTLSPTYPRHILQLSRPSLAHITTFPPIPGTYYNFPAHPLHILQPSSPSPAHITTFPPIPGTYYKPPAAPPQPHPKKKNTTPGTP